MRKSSQWFKGPLMTLKLWVLISLYLANPETRVGFTILNVMLNNLHNPK